MTILLLQPQCHLHVALLAYCVLYRSGPQRSIVMKCSQVIDMFLHALQGMEVLRALAAASTTCMQALQQSNCIDTCLTVLDRADLNSNSNMRTTVLAALLLHDALDWDLARRQADTVSQVDGLMADSVGIRFSSLTTWNGHPMVVIIKIVLTAKYWHPLILPSMHTSGFSRLPSACVIRTI